jgi:hypothetical protein
MTLARFPRSALLSLIAAGLLLPVAASAQKPPKKERNRISREELIVAADRYAVLYDAVRNLRPQFLTVNSRGVRTTGIGPSDPLSRNSRPGLGGGGSNAVDAKAIVYLDGVKSGDTDFLKTISTSTVEEVRYYSVNEAESEFGPHHEGGAIAVKLLKGDKP